MTLAAIATAAVLDTAYDGLCTRRQAWTSRADVWRFRQDGSEAKDTRRQALLAGAYHGGRRDRITLSRAGAQAEIAIGSARDALVMPALSLL